MEREMVPGREPAQGKPIHTADECARLQALSGYDILDTPREREFDDIAELAAEICGTPIAVVNFIGDGRQFFKAEVGLRVRETPLETSFCRQAILQNDFLHVPDAVRDPRFACNPLMTGEPGLRFYAGALLKTADGHPVGTVCVLDTGPRDLTERQQAGLRRLAHQTKALLEARRNARAQQIQKELQQRILDSATDYAVIAMDRGGRVTRWSTGAEHILGWREEEMLGDPAHVFFTPEDREAGRPEAEMALALKEGFAPDERWHLRKGGERFWANGELMPLKAADGTVQGFVKILCDRTLQRAEAAERNASELRFRSLVEVSPQVVWFGDAAGKITYCNPTCYAYTGLPPGDTGGDGWTGVIHPDHRERVLGVWKHAIANEGTYEVEIPFRRASDGAYRWFRARGKPVRSETGLVESWIGIAIDIHDRRQAEVNLRQAREQLRLAVEATGTGVFDYDLVSDELKWDARILSLYSLPPDAPVDLAVHLARVHPDDRARADRAVRAAVDPAGDGVYDVTYHTVSPEDGSERWVSAKGQTLFEDGRPVRLIGFARDVTESRRAEQPLRETEERYRLVSRATNDAIWDWTFATNRVLWNEALGTAHGYAPGAIDPTGDWRIGRIHPDDRARIDASIHAVVDGTGTVWTDEYRFLRADGSYADILDRGYVIRDEGGRAMRMIGAMLDITERKRAEEHQRLLTGELQHRVKNTLALVQAIAGQPARRGFGSRLIERSFAAEVGGEVRFTYALTGLVCRLEAPLASLRERCGAAAA